MSTSYLKGANNWDCQKKRGQSRFWSSLIKVKNMMMLKWSRDDRNRCCSNGYTVNIGYKMLCDPHPVLQNPEVCPRQGFILWLIIWERLRTRKWLYEKGLVMNDDCGLCDPDVEDTDPLVFHCDYSTEVFCKVMTIVKLSCRRREKFDEVVQWMIKVSKGKSRLAKQRRCSFAGMVYTIWRARNMSVFQGCSMSIDDVLFVIIMQLMLGCVVLMLLVWVESYVIFIISSDI